MVGGLQDETHLTIVSVQSLNKLPDFSEKNRVKNQEDLQEGDENEFIPIIRDFYQALTPFY